MWVMQLKPPLQGLDEQTVTGNIFNSIEGQLLSLWVKKTPVELEI